MFRYSDRYDHIAKRAPILRAELLADLAVARDLANDPPQAGPDRPFDAPAAIAAAALEANLRDGIEVSKDDLTWAAGVLVALLNILADQGAFEADYSVFGSGVDRSAARALPLLLMPSASGLREQLATEGIDEEAIARAIRWIIKAGANEARLFLARGFDSLWETPCDTTVERCHHVVALATIEDIARDCLIGPWDSQQQRNQTIHIDGPVASDLPQAACDRVNVPRLSASIRGTAAAAVSSACCRTNAYDLLKVLLAAHRRGMCDYKHGYNHSSDDAAAAARAVLEIAATGDSSILFSHLDAYADKPRLLGEFLHALAAVGEETKRRATAAREVWPAVLERVLHLVESGACPRNDRHYAQDPLAAVIPTPSYELGYLHREFEGDSIPWEDPVALTSQIKRWLPLAAGYSRPLDALVQLLDRIPSERQAEVGLPWIEFLVQANPERIANHSFLLPGWLERMRPHVVSPPLRDAWHRIVDTLTVAGDNRVASLGD